MINKIFTLELIQQKIHAALEEIQYGDVNSARTLLNGALTLVKELKEDAK